ncbi:MAG: alpha/beta hydrolase [Acidobacteriota bacterium]
MSMGFVRGAAALAGAILLAASVSCSPTNLKQGAFTTELNGRKIHYEIAGTGPVLMTVPNSWGLSHEGLMGLYRPLEEHFTLIYFDPRGMGESGPLLENADMGMAAVREDFQALRQHLGLGKVAAIGWSNGASNLVFLAAEHPETLSAVIFVHGLASFTAEDERAIAETHPELFQAANASYGAIKNGNLSPGEADAKLKQFYVEEYFPALCADPDSTRSKIASAFASASFSFRHTEYANEELPRFDARDKLAAITVPALVLAGEHDLLPTEKAVEMKEGMPNALLRVFKDSGHFAPLEEPRSFVASVREFMVGLDTRS